MSNTVRILFICCIILFSFIDKLNAQSPTLFKSSEVDSLEYYCLPLYSSDSVKVENIKGAKLINLFYLNGDCSICIYKMKKAEGFFQSNKSNLIKNLFIVETLDTINFNFHRDKYNIETPVLWDKNYYIRKKLEFDENNLFILLNSFGRILLKGDVINDNITQEKYFK